MAHYFFYGSLMDADVLSAVTGERIPPGRLIPARLAGYERLCARYNVFPVLVEYPGAEVAGMLVRGIDAAAARRLARYEGPDYVLAKRSITTAEGNEEAFVFLYARPGRSSGKPWNFDAWRRRHKRRLLRALTKG
jgi:gamma-glutamylcyclotransferase (GGCT)/AIG2-like uncharacterized protein YtfP